MVQEDCSLALPCVAVALINCCSGDLIRRLASSLADLQRSDDVKDDDFDVDDELEKPVFSKAGDLWILGRHRLLVGDATKDEDMDILMNGEKANLVVTDPPYNVDYEGSAGKIKYKGS